MQMTDDDWQVSYGLSICDVISLVADMCLAALHTGELSSWHVTTHIEARLRATRD